ncbi:MAG: hypothetical protein WBP45_01350, partial [Daejeonella sp.]
MTLKKTSKIIKREVKASNAPTSRAFDHGLNAAGASQIKPGFCFTPEDDLAFALGFPHLKFLVDDEQDPRAMAEKLLLDGYPYQHASYGRETAVRLVRALFLPVSTKLDSNGNAVALPEAIEAMDRNHPLLPEETREYIINRVAINQRPFAS